ncbi:head-tail adaptor protein [Clostridium sp. CTA-7]
MMRRKLTICFLLIIMSFYLLSACTKKENNREAKIDLFSPKTAVDVAETYLNFVKENNMDMANSLCTDSLLSRNKEITTGTSRIVSYEPDNLIESTGSAYATFNVVRNSPTEAKCDLDNYAIKVVKVGNEYKIDEIKSMNKKQVFVRNNSLRIIGEEGGKSDLILNLNNLPKDVYIKENRIMLYKEKAPVEAFGPISVGYKGQKVALSTIGNNKTFLSIAYIEESKATQAAQPSQADQGSSKAGGADASKSIEEVLDKPIVKKVVPLDILDNAIVKNLVFSKEEGYLIVEYLNSNKLNRINIYNSAQGDLVKIKFNEMFPEDKYNVELKSFDKNTITVKVSGKEGRNDINSDVTGEYKVNMEAEEVKKNI